MAIIPLATSADTRGAEKLNKVLAKSDAELKEMTKSARGFDAAARRITENQNPQERYNRKLAETAMLLKQGKINMAAAQVEASRLTQQLDRTGGAARAAFGPNVLNSVSTLTGGIFSVGGAVATVRKELELLKKDAAAINQSQVTAAGAREKLLQNIAQLSDAERNSFIARAEKLAAKQSLPQAVVDSALADAYSGSGGNVDAAFRNVRTSARYNRNSPDAIAPTAGALSDVAKATLDTDATRNLGLLNKIGAASRVVDPKKQFGTIPQALAGMVTAEATAQQSGALYAALSNAMSDQEGNITTNAAINFGAKLEEFADKQIKAGKLSKSIDTFQERLAAVQGNQELGKAFVSMMGGEAKAKGVLEQLVLDPNSAIAREYQSVQGGFGNRAAQIAHGKRTLGIIAGDRYGQVSSTDRTIKSGGDSLRLTPFDVQLSEEAKDELYKQMRQTSPSVRAFPYGGNNFLPGVTESMRVYGRVGETVSRTEAIGLYRDRIRQLEEIISTSPEHSRYQASDPMNIAIRQYHGNAEFAHETNAQLAVLKEINGNLVKLQSQSEDNTRRTIEAGRGGRQE